ncbi:MAG: DUF983 domain-containing protein [Kiloniellales bacterium]|jgi:uncharacterized protein (DUF983 family)
MPEDSYYPKRSPIAVGLACRCPRCGRGKLYSGYLTVAERCGLCGLDLGKADSGDGPAVFIILILGAVVVGLALLLEIHVQPPMWVHMTIWPALILGGALGMLRPAKALLIALQYRYEASDSGTVNYD